MAPVFGVRATKDAQKRVSSPQVNSGLLQDMREMFRKLDPHGTGLLTEAKEREEWLFHLS